MVRVPGDFSTREVAPPPPPYWVPPEPTHPDPSRPYLEDTVFHGKKIGERDLNHPELPELALSLALRDYTQKSGIKSCCLALSGGRDSSMVALLVQRMHAYGSPDLGPEALAEQIRDRFLCVPISPPRTPARRRVKRPRAVAEEISATFIDGKDPAGALSAAHEVVESMTGFAPGAGRIRATTSLCRTSRLASEGMLIWTLANLHNALLLAVTSNKSRGGRRLHRRWTATPAAGASPLIADVPKSLIKLYLD